MVCRNFILTEIANLVSFCPFFNLRNLLYLTKDFTVDQVNAWLESLKSCPDDKAVRLLVERIDIKQKPEVVVTSTLTTVVSEYGCGGRF